MADVIRGKDKILLFRKLEDAGEETAAKLALQTTHTISYERDTNTTQTKDGPVNSNSNLTTTISIEALLTRDDPASALLRDAVIDGYKVEVWEVDLGSKGEGNKYKALYGQGSLSSWEDPADVEEDATLSTEMAIDGELQKGEVTLTQEQESTIQYAFRDITPFSAG
jgi:TP901-1 family phage major tail protein